MVYLNILLIAIIWVFIIDISGFTYEIKTYIAKLLKIGKAEDVKDKPFFCSLCLTWWTGLFFLIFTHGFCLLNVAYLLFIACSTPIIKDVYYLFFDSLQTFLSYLSKKLK